MESKVTRGEGFEDNCEKLKKLMHAKIERSKNPTATPEERRLAAEQARILSNDYQRDCGKSTFSRVQP